LYEYRRKIKDYRREHNGEDPEFLQEILPYYPSLLNY